MNTGMARIRAEEWQQSDGPFDFKCLQNMLFLSGQCKAGLLHVHAWKAPSANQMGPAEVHGFQQRGYEGFESTLRKRNGVAIMTSTITHKSAGLRCYGRKNHDAVQVIGLEYGLLVNTDFQRGAPWRRMVKTYDGCDRREVSKVRNTALRPGCSSQAKGQHCLDTSWFKELAAL